MALSGLRPIVSSRRALFPFPAYVILVLSGHLPLIYGLGEWEFEFRAGQTHLAAVARDGVRTTWLVLLMPLTAPVAQQTVKALLL